MTTRQPMSLDELAKLFSTAMTPPKPTEGRPSAAEVAEAKRAVAQASLIRSIAGTITSVVILVMSVRKYRKVNA